MARVVSAQRPIVKAITYRMIAMCMDFAAIYPFTGKVRDAIGFMIASNGLYDRGLCDPREGLGAGDLGAVAT